MRAARAALAALALVAAPGAWALRRISPAEREREALRSLRARVRQQAVGNVSWVEDELVVVPAVFEIGWDTHLRELKNFTQLEQHGPWSEFVYQRTWENEPFFVPNYGFEGAVYLRFIVDHYDNLPAVMLFVQEDFKFSGTENCLRRDSLTYRDFHRLWVQRRQLWTWRNRGYGAAVEQCWRDFGEIFELEGFEPRAELSVSFFCCNNFAVGREQVRRRPLSQWKAAYAKATAPLCHEGALDLGNMSNLTLLFGGLNKSDVAFDEAGLTKHTTGGALEHLASMIYGFYPPDGPEPDVQARACEDFLPSSVCPGSPCIS